MRSFTISAIYDKGRKIRFDGGRYMSETPAKAAAKAFNKACQYLNKKGRASLVVKLRETTSGSDKKTYMYKVRRVKQQREVYKNGVLVVYMYTTKVKSIN